MPRYGPLAAGMKPVSLIYVESETAQWINFFDRVETIAVHLCLYTWHLQFWIENEKYFITVMKETLNGTVAFELYVNAMKPISSLSIYMAFVILNLEWKVFHHSNEWHIKRRNDIGTAPNHYIWNLEHCQQNFLFL